MLADVCARRGEENISEACGWGAESHERLADVIEYAELRGDWIDRQYLAFAHGEAYSPAPEKRCGCYQCISREIEDKPFPHNTVQFMVLCESCGNKRCPHAEHHGNPCTGSNGPGQPGAVRYPVLTPEERRERIRRFLADTRETNERESNA